MSETPERGRSALTSRLESALVWTMGHLSHFWPFVVFGIVLALSWQALRYVHPGEFRIALRALDARWLAIAGAITAANVGAMGLYDVVAFRRTKSRWTERWRYGAVAFAWSNFLTLGPLAGPAMRFWLYRPAVEEASELHHGVVSVALAFTSGLIGWTLAILVDRSAHVGVAATAVLAIALVFGTVTLGRIIVQRFEKIAIPPEYGFRSVELAFIGWLDWLLAAAAFIACTKSTGASDLAALARSFFLGQAIGVASLVPGGFGSSDAFWIAHLPLAASTAAAALTAFRVIYYVLPWTVASLVLLAWVSRRAPKRLEIARRSVASLVGGGGVLMMLSSATPALYSRLPLLERFVPLPLVEAGHVTAALAGLLLLVLARGLARGYRAALRATLALLMIAALAAILKGLDWEEAVVLGGLAAATWSQSALFTRPSRGDWVEGPDLIVAFGALALFVVFGTVGHRVSAVTLERWTHFGYRLQAVRFVRTAASMSLAVIAGALYVLLRTPVRLRQMVDAEIDTVLAKHREIGGGTTPMMVATADKSAFMDEKGFCLYSAIGPYLVVFSDPVVADTADRAAFLDALFSYAGEIDRRPLFYQISLDWIPALHDRGYDFFKLGEEAHVVLQRVTLEGHAGKMYRQVLRRGERDGVRFRVLAPYEIEARLTELAEISQEWLRRKGLAERQFSIGSFTEPYMRRFPCAIVEETKPDGRILAFANLLEGPKREEFSVDLMRYRSDGPQVMDFLMVSLFLYAKKVGYARFNIGMAPLAWVGEQRGAHARERLARLLFQRGEQWYNFQGLRFYKQKFDPDWIPRYMAYQNAWEWPMAIAYASALIAGGWMRILLPARDQKPESASALPGNAPPQQLGASA